MRIPSNLRSAIIALSLLAPLGMAGSALADNSNAQAAPQQQAAVSQQQTSNSGPYDSPDFVIPLSQTY